MAIQDGAFWSDSPAGVTVWALLVHGVLDGFLSAAGPVCLCGSAPEGSEECGSSRRPGLLSRSLVPACGWPFSALLSGGVLPSPRRMQMNCFGRHARGRSAARPGERSAAGQSSRSCALRGVGVVGISAVSAERVHVSDKASFDSTRSTLHLGKLLEMSGRERGRGRE